MFRLSLDNTEQNNVWSDLAMNAWLCVFLVVLSAGCSNRGLYYLFQQSASHDCSKLPSPQNRECEERNNQSYDEYKNQRKQDIHSP